MRQLGTTYPKQTVVNLLTIGILGFATSTTLSARPGHCDTDGRLHPYYGDDVKNGVNFFKDLGPCDQKGKDVVIKFARPVQDFTGLIEGSKGGTVRIVGSGGQVLAESAVDTKGAFSFPSRIVDSLAAPPVLCYASRGQRQTCGESGKFVLKAPGTASLRVIPTHARQVPAMMRTRPQDCKPPNEWNGFTCIDSANPRNPQLPRAN